MYYAFYLFYLLFAQTQTTVQSPIIRCKVTLVRSLEQFLALALALPCTPELVKTGPTLRSHHLLWLATVAPGVPQSWTTVRKRRKQEKSQGGCLHGLSWSLEL